MRFAIVILLAACGPGLDTSVLDAGQKTNAPPASTNAPPKSADPAPESTPDAPDTNTRAPSGPTGATAATGPRVVVDTLISGRSKLGARSIVSFRPWRTGLVATADRVVWVESGTAAGLYASAIASPSAQPLATMTRPSAFAASAGYVYVADVTVMKRWSLASSTAEDVASDTNEIDNLAATDMQAFWTSGDDSAIHFTAVGGATSTPIYSNGTPVALGLAGATLYWAGVDISGLLGAIQLIGTDGKGAREVSRFSSGFSLLRGNGTFAYYVEGANVHRLALSSGHDDTVATDATPVHDIAVDDSYAYWVEQGDAPDYANGRVRRIAHDALSAETLAPSVPLPIAVAVSSAGVFVASAGTKAAGYGDGKILRLTISE
jgi:hypothetical protein